MPSHRLAQIEPSHIETMLTWFTGEQQIAEWGGPAFHYPFDLTSFTRDLKLEQLDSFSLLGESSNLLGFGQCYVRLERCHLARLAINPLNRGERLIDSLMTMLIEFGQQKFNTSEVSLFVLEHNNAALNAYRRYGFSVTPYPEKIPLENCLYMVKAT